MVDATKKISELVPGDLVDLERDPFADPEGEHIQFQSEYAVVASVDIETPQCTAIEFEGFDQVGFPPDHRVKIGVAQ